ncbi:hypothetical protein MUS1_07140 [Marinomonas ushuaiensis DSM 15871]|uniref:Lipoprotein n=1 Tax=Marinomonas ushuaiensis DSM 15871 TaxID=1122207 RepID=X7E982_9GAMM|nr:hypothetical protein [Marinomonas ushuaiensis]ETX11713.1 hypothetical protein MUS1_07140 [Marinomonas ushuaiensis DSM 15871]
MNKFTLQLVSVGSLAVLLSGCSLFFTDHSDDYQDVAKTHSSLESPEGSTPSKDALVIPNEDAIADLVPAKPFVTPRAPFIFHPMVAVGVVEKEDAIEFSVPTNKDQAKRVVTDFLTALYGEGKSIASQTDDQITSIAFDFHPQGWWASLYSKITRLYPAKTVFAFSFTESEDKTLVRIQFRDEVQDAEVGPWMTPVENSDAHTIAVRLWGTFGRQLNQSSAYLSNQNDASSYPIWVDHHGLYGIRLNDASQSGLETTLNAAGIYLVPGADNVLAPVSPEKIARVGDVIDFSIPTGSGETQKLFNVRRRNLDDVSWDLREYSYKITEQKAGKFLMIDVSSVEQPEDPEVVSFHFAQRFLSN